MGELAQLNHPGRRGSSRARVLAIASGKGGVGKSSIALNLALHLSRRGHRVCLFDADTNLANLNILLGLAPEYTLQALLQGEKGLDEILLEAPEGLRIVPAASGIEEFIELDPEQQRRLLAALQALERQFDYLLVDTAAGIQESTLQLLLAAGGLLLLITPEPTSLTDAFSLLKVLRRYGLDHPVQVVVNMADNRAAAHDSFKRFQTSAARFLQLDVGYLGYVLRDEQMAAAVMQQNPILLSRPEAVASLCLQSIGNRLEQRLDKSVQGGLSDFFGRLQLTDAELDRLHPFVSGREAAVAELERETEEPTPPEQPEPPPEPTAEEDEERERRDLMSATYYAGLLGALERNRGR